MSLNYLDVLSELIYVLFMWKDEKIVGLVDDWVVVANVKLDLLAYSCNKLV